MGWRTVSLGEVLDVKHGYAFKSEYFREEGPYVLLTPGNFLDDGGFKWASKQKYYEGPVDKRFVLTRGELLVAMTEQAEGLLGSCLRVPGDQTFLHNQRLGKIVCSQIDPGFAYYLLNSKSVRRPVRATSSGTKVRHTSPDRIKEIEVDIPPLPIQRRIAGILSAYDDLIEVNTRRIKALEEMAARTYEEWFVHLADPEWPVVEAHELIDFDPTTKVARQGEKIFVPMAALSQSGMMISGVEIKAGNSGSKFQNGDTLLARITPCLENGKTGFVDFLPPEQPTACGSTEFIVMRGKTVPPEFVYLLARSDSFREIAVLSMSGATGRQRVRRESLQSAQLTQPPDALLGIFSDLMKPKFMMIRVLSDQNINLRAQRDLLLPRLVSGQINVSEAESCLEVAAE